MAAALKRAYPDTEVHWLVNAGFEEAVSAHPGVDRAVPFPRGALGRDSRRLRLDRVLAWLNGLRRERYDLVIDAQGLGRSGGIARWTGARTRVGFRDARELGWLGCTNRVDVPPAVTHTVDRMMALVDAVLPRGATGDRPETSGAPDMRLYAPGDAEAWARGPSGPSSGSGLAYAAVAPTSVWEAKRWPIDRYADLVAELLDQPALERVAVVGGPSERDECGPLLERFGGDPRVLDLVGATGVGRLLAVIAGAELVVANDSAAAHIAVGFGRPLVALFGPTDTARVGPYRRERDVIQHADGVTFDGRALHKDPANRTLMERISVDEVVAACRERLGR